MHAKERREMILSRLEQACDPVSATALAGALSVSRQVIVGDIALLRASGVPIAATPRGYVLSRPKGIVRAFVACGKARQSSRHAQAFKICSTSRQYFVYVGLMSHVKKNAVVGRIENAVKRHRQLHNAKIGGEMSASLRHLIH